MTDQPSLRSTSPYGQPGHWRWLLRLGLVLLCFGVLYMARPQPQRVRAAVINVTTTADDNVVNGNCSLREAIQAANLNVPVDACPAGDAGLDIINLPAGTYTLTAIGSLNITDSISIVGESAATTIIDGGGLNRVFDIGGAGAIAITFTGITIQNGVAPPGEEGGGVRMTNVNGNLTIVNSVVRQNSATFFGGGIYNFGQLSLIESTVANNQAPNGGGGIVTVFGSLSIVDSTISSNTSNGTGLGGGVAYVGTANIVRSTFTGNSGVNSAAIYGSGTGTILNSTISANLGAPAIRIEVTSTLSIGSSTIVNNPVGGIELDPMGGVSTLNLRNSILAWNAPGADGDCNLVSGTIAGAMADEYNLVTSAASVANCFTPGANDIEEANSGIVISVLANNGGFTFTHALALGSPALDAANPAGCQDFTATPLATDQRGTGRIFNGQCDIGAFEFAEFTLNMTINPPGGGTVFSAPIGINCGADCTELYVAGTLVTLNSSAAPGYAFVSFTGDADCTDGVVQMLTNLSCTANFILATPTFTPSPTEGLPTETPTITPTLTPTLTITPSPTITQTPTPTPAGQLTVGSAGGTFECNGWQITIRPGTAPDGSVLFCRGFDALAGPALSGGLASLQHRIYVELYRGNGERIVPAQPPLQVCYRYTDADVVAAGGSPANFVLLATRFGGQWSAPEPTLDFNTRLLCVNSESDSLFDIFTHVPRFLPITGGDE